MGKDMAVNRDHKRFTTWKRALFATLATVAMAATSTVGTSLASATEGGVADEPTSTAQTAPAQGDTDAAPTLTADTAANDDTAGVTPEQAAAGDAPRAPRAPALKLEKSVELPTDINRDYLKPGDTFNYWISVLCLQENCNDAKITDALPKELLGMEIVGATATATGGPSTVGSPALTWAPEDPTGKVIDKDYTLTATPKLANGSNAIPIGESVKVKITVRIPADFPWTNFEQGNGSATFKNEAQVTANDVATPVTGAAEVTVKVDLKMAVATTKTWTPKDPYIKLGAESQVEITALNTSNAPAETLTIQEPKNAADGDSALDANNPFRLNDFAGFGATTMPEGATSVKTEVYVKDQDGKYAWVAGASGLPLRLGTVAEKDVAGIRVVYEGNIAEKAKATAASVTLKLEQREDVRDSDPVVKLKELEEDQKVVNTVQGIVSKVDKSGEEEKVVTATSDGSVTQIFKPAKTGAKASKAFSPSRVQPGDPSTATLRGTNTGEIGATTLTITDDGAGFFVAEKLTFNGFTSFVPPKATPEGDVQGAITYTCMDGSTPSVDHTQWTDAADCPGGNADVSGFKVVWTAPEGSVFAKDAFSEAKFDVKTYENQTYTPNPWTKANKAKTEVETENFGPADDSTSASLTVFKPTMDVTLKKSVSPSTPISPEERVLVQLAASYESRGSDVAPTKVVIEDTYDATSSLPNGGFWNGFNLYSIAPTGVPSGSLEIAVQVPGIASGASGDVGGGWCKVLVAGPKTASLTNTQLLEKLGSECGIASPKTDAITGVRFAFDQLPGVSGNVIPNIMFEARDELRNGPGKTYKDPPANDPNADGYEEEYPNLASYTAENTNSAYVGPDGQPVKDSGDSTVSGVPNPVGQVRPPIVKVEPGGPTNPDDPAPGPQVTPGKVWMQKNANGTFSEKLSLGALTGDTVYTALNWKLGERQAGEVAADWVVIQDYGNITPPGPTDPAYPEQIAKTVFDTFDLVGVGAIANNATVGSNGWALRWDKITQIQIWNGQDWVTPAGAVQQASGNYVNVTYDPDTGIPTAASFPGVVLNDAEREYATSLRIRVEPNVEARAVAQAADEETLKKLGITDRTTIPEINAGVVSTADARQFMLQWKLRYTLRSNPETFVTPNYKYNEHCDVNGEHCEKVKGRVNNTMLVSVTNRVESSEKTIDLVWQPVSVDSAKTASVWKITTDDDGQTTEKQICPVAGSPKDCPLQSPDDTVRYTTTATNSGAVSPTYLRISDPMGDESDYFENTQAAIEGDPYALSNQPDGGWLKPGDGDANPFDRLKMTGVKVTTDWQLLAPVDPSDPDAPHTNLVYDASTAWVLRYNGVAYTSERMSVTQLNALDADALKDVVGVTVTFKAPPAEEGSVTAFDTLIPDKAKFTMVIDSKLRDNVLSTGAPTHLGPNEEVPIINNALAQVWDPHMSMGDNIPNCDDSDDPTCVPPEPAATADRSDVRIVQKGQIIEIEPAVKIAPKKVLEAERVEHPDMDINVTLSATPGASQLAPTEVWVRDDIENAVDCGTRCFPTSERFWEVFELKGLTGGLNGLKWPSGADQMQFYALFADSSGGAGTD